MNHAKCKLPRGQRASRPSFTLVELLIVLAILSVLASAILVAAWGAQEDARAARTRTQIIKLHELIMTRWDSYRTRPVSIRIPATAAPLVAADTRLWAIRELQRRELPDRITDVLPGTLTFSSGGKLSPTLHRSYQRRAQSILGSSWATVWANNPSSFEGAECLYMIIASMRDGDTNGLDFLHPKEIGDVDADGMPEILDAWGNPIFFIRWPAGLQSEMQPRNASTSPDPFDPLKVDPRLRDADSTNDTYALFPLIYSAGRDGAYDIEAGYSSSATLDYSTHTSVLTPTFPVTRYPDPYVLPPTGYLVGTPRDTDGNGYDEFEDNITNHLLAHQ